MRLFRRLHKHLIVKRESSVIRMSDNIDIGLLHRLHICPCILLSRMPQPIARRMDARDHNIQITACLFRQIDVPVRIHDIDFRPEQKPDSAHLSWYYIQILKIKQPAGSRHLGRVLRDRKRLKSLRSRSLRHLPHGIVCMAAGQCMGMCIYFKYHISVSSSITQHIITAGLL